MVIRQLTFIVETEHGRAVVVRQFPFSIGRAEDCQLRLASNGVSRQHARLKRAGDGSFLIEDAGSTNGTYVNGHPLRAPTALSSGDQLQLGDAMLRAEIKELDQPTLVPAPSAAADRTTGTYVVLKGADQMRQQYLASAGDADSKRALQRLADLIEVAKTLSNASSIEAIFGAVREVVLRDVKGIERIALLLDRGGAELELTEAGDRIGTAREVLLRNPDWVSRSICRKAFEEKVALRTGDAMNDARFEGKASIVIKGIRSALAVPVWGDGQVIGVLYADASMTMRDWHASHEQDLSFFSTLGNLVAYSVQRWLLQERLKQEEHFRTRLERYHSPQVVQQLMNQGALSDGPLEPQEREITVMFADLVGFTAMSERLQPAEVARVLNQLFDAMLSEIFEVGGTLDKFIGDCIMAFFGAPESQPDHAERAVRAATGMLRRLRELNASGALAQPLALRIGINSGRAVVGDVGSARRVDYTVLGAAVNLASRLESACPPGSFVVSEYTHAMLAAPRVRLLGEHRFKGIDRPIKVYAGGEEGA